MILPFCIEILFNGSNQVTRMNENGEKVAEKIKLNQLG